MNADNKLIQPIAALALATGILLLIPLTAMQFTDEVVWTLSDFIIAGALLFGTGFSYILVTRILAPGMGDNIVYRFATGTAVATGLFLIWANLAVGIIGSEDNPINIFYFGVIVVGIIGAFIARFKPKEMAFTLLAMAIAQAIIALIALFNGMAEMPGSSVYEILAVNGFFITLFVVSALLFRHAAQEQSAANEKSETGTGS